VSTGFLRQRGGIATSTDRYAVDPTISACPADYFEILPAHFTSRVVDRLENVLYPRLFAVGREIGFESSLYPITNHPKRGLIHK
jgi:hypothetical protein